jgi:hypothetical protein
MRPIVVGTLLLVATAARALDVNTCGTTVPAGETAELVADLDCGSAPFLSAVVLESNASLALNGHEISGVASGSGVHCTRACAIGGPGTITGARTAITGARGITLSNVALTGNEGSIDAPLGRLRLTDVTADSSRYGIRGKRVDVTNVQVTNAGGDCILGKIIRGSGVTVSGCHTGIGSTRSVRLVGLSATTNQSVGLSALGSVELTDSTVTGNSFLADPLDLVTRRLPKLVNTTCGTSGRLLRQPGGTYLIGAPWGVCADD